MASKAKFFEEKINEQKPKSVRDQISLETELHTLSDLFSPLFGM